MGEFLVSFEKLTPRLQFSCQARRRWARSRDCAGRSATLYPRLPSGAPGLVTARWNWEAAGDVPWDRTREPCLKKSEISAPPGPWTQSPPLPAPPQSRSVSPSGGDSAAEHHHPGAKVAILGPSCHPLPSSLAIGSRGLHSRSDWSSAVPLSLAPASRRRG